LANCNVIPQAIGLLQNPSQKRDASKALSAIHDLSGPIFYPTDKTNIIANCSE
jgi:hypothetical protein